MRELFQSAFTLLGIRLTSAQIEALSIYEQQLLEWNERVNLTAIRDPEKIRIKHFLDSLTCLLAMRTPPWNGWSMWAAGLAFPEFH